MAKQWFNYNLPAQTCGPQLIPGNYTLIGPYPGAGFCALATRTCIIYSFYSSGSPVRPANTAGGTPAISPNIQSYINSFCVGGGGAPVQDQPLTGKKVLYVRGI